MPNKEHRRVTRYVLLLAAVLTLLPALNGPASAQIYPDPPPDFSTVNPPLRTYLTPTGIIPGRLLKFGLQVGAIKNIVTENHGAAVIPDKIFTNQEGLRQTIGRVLHGI